MMEYDLYTGLLDDGNGTLHGVNHQGAILYGRVGEPLDKFPDFFLKSHASQFGDDCCFSAYCMDIYAIQFGVGPESVTHTTRGRILVLTESTHPSNTVTALACKLFYNRSAGDCGAENNLVVGCFYECTQEFGVKSFKLQPARRVPTAVMNIPVENAAQFIEEMVLPNQMIEHNTKMFRRKLGNECPLLAGTPDIPQPVFFRVGNNKRLLLQSAYSYEYDKVEYPSLCETRQSWGIVPELAAALHLKEYLSTRSFLELREPHPILRTLEMGIASAKELLDANIKSYIANPHGEFVPRLNNILNRVSSFLMNTWHTTQYGKSGFQRFKAMLRLLVSNSESEELTDWEDEISQIAKEGTAHELVSVLFETEDKKMYPDSALSSMLSDWGFGVGCKYYGLISFIWSVLELRSAFSPLFAGVNNVQTLFYLIFNRPYALTFLHPDMGIEALDLLACFTGTANEPQMVIPLRSAAFMHNHLCSETGNSSRSLIFKRGTLYPKTGYTLTKKYQANYRETGGMLNAFQQALSQELLGEVDNRLIPPAYEPYVVSDKLVIPLDIDVDMLMYHYLSSGLGIEITHAGERYLMDYSHAYQFAYCMHRLYKTARLNNRDLEYSKYRADFEALKGFTLEDEQARAAELLNFGAGCLVGTAGSGKTTTLEYLIYCLKNAQGISEDKVALVAPTGMAARRMSDCTGVAASTINSRFRIHDSGFSWRDTEKKKGLSKSYDVVIFDEASMMSLSLLYKALVKLPDDTRLYFVGDTAQLPSIDPCKMLVDMLTFLPFVRLNVTKRASGLSGITANCTNLLGSAPMQLSSGVDVGVIPCRDDDSVVEIISDLCSYHMGGAIIPNVEEPLRNPDNSPRVFAPLGIQVVTPVSKASYSWSSTRLNLALQDIFNPKKRGMMRVYFTDTVNGDCELRVGDRVLNSTNRYEEPRYVWHDKATLTLQQVGMGVMNGDIGVIKEIRVSTDFNFVKETDDGILPDTEALKLASFSSATTKVYILVEFTGSAGDKYMVKYVGYADAGLHSGVQVTPSRELRSLSLAYAVTVHKMQGNQADLVIAPLFSCKGRNNNFVNRNLVYTAWSRATKGLYIIGDVSSAQGSTLARARACDSNASRLSPFDLSR